MSILSVNDEVDDGLAIVCVLIVLIASGCGWGGELIVVIDSE